MHVFEAVGNSSKAWPGFHLNLFSEGKVSWEMKTSSSAGSLPWSSGFVRLWGRRTSLTRATWSDSPRIGIQIYFVRLDQHIHLTQVSNLRTQCTLMSLPRILVSSAPLGHILVDDLISWCFGGVRQYKRNLSQTCEKPVIPTLHNSIFLLRRLS